MGAVQLEDKFLRFDLSECDWMGCGLLSPDHQLRGSHDLLGQRQEQHLYDFVAGFAVEVVSIVIPPAVFEMPRPEPACPEAASLLPHPEAVSSLPRPEAASSQPRPAVVSGS